MFEDLPMDYPYEVRNYQSCMILYYLLYRFMSLNLNMRVMRFCLWKKSVLPKRKGYSQIAREGKVKERKVQSQFHCPSFI